MPTTIRVRLLTLAAGPHFQHHPGQEADLPAAQAEEMIAAGYAQRLSPAAEPEPPAPTAEVEAGPESWTATAAETEDGPDDDPEEKEEPVPEARSTTGPVETATAGPQRNGDADDQLAAEKAGVEAARAKGPRTGNPYDGRSSLGRAWFRGWDSVK
jgi:hypothetical protein